MCYHGNPFITKRMELKVAAMVTHSKPLFLSHILLWWVGWVLIFIGITAGKHTVHYTCTCTSQTSVV